MPGMPPRWELGASVCPAPALSQTSRLGKGAWLPLVCPGAFSSLATPAEEETPALFGVWGYKGRGSPGSPTWAGSRGKGVRVMGPRRFSAHAMSACQSGLFTQWGKGKVIRSLGKGARRGMPACLPARRPISSSSAWGSSLPSLPVRGWGGRKIWAGSSRSASR